MTEAQKLTFVGNGHLDPSRGTISLVLVYNGKPKIIASKDDWDEVSDIYTVGEPQTGEHSVLTVENLKNLGMVGIYRKD